MSAAPKRKGTRFERELVHAFQAAGLRAQRAWGSNGRALRTDRGERCTSDVDLLVEGCLKVQAKRRRSVASYLKPPDGAHLTIVREDGGEAVAVVPLALLTRMLSTLFAREQSTETEEVSHVD